MAKYIDAEKLIAEIEKRQEARQDRRDSASWGNEYWPEGEFCTRDDEDDAILSIITSLQQEQPCLPFNVDEAAENYYEQDCPYPGEARVVNNEHDVWFPSRAIEDAFIAGAKWQKEQMMKKAVEGEYDSYPDSYPAAIYLETPVQGIEHCDKVRVIICKKED